MKSHKRKRTVQDEEKTKVQKRKWQKIIPKPNRSEVEEALAVISDQMQGKEGYKHLNGVKSAYSHYTICVKCPVPGCNLSGHDNYEGKGGLLPWQAGTAYDHKLKEFFRDHGKTAPTELLNYPKQFGAKSNLGYTGCTWHTAHGEVDGFQCRKVIFGTTFHCGFWPDVLVGALAIERVLVWAGVETSYHAYFDEHRAIIEKHVKDYGLTLQQYQTMKNQFKKHRNKIFEFYKKRISELKDKNLKKKKIERSFKSLKKAVNGITEKQIEGKKKPRKKPRKKRSLPVSKKKRAVKSRSRPKKQVEITTMPTLEPDVPAEPKPLVSDENSMKPKPGVPKKTAKRADYEDDEGSDVKCQACGRGDNTDKLLLCDHSSCKNVGFHIYCITPKLSTIPDGDWFCPKHQKSQGPTIIDITYSSDEEKATSAEPSPEETDMKEPVIEEKGIATEPSENSMMKKLKEMGLEKFYGKFVEQRITEDMFPEITESYLNELGFFIGDKIRWKRHFPEKPEAAPPSIPAKRRKQNHSVKKGSVVVKVESGEVGSPIAFGNVQIMMGDAWEKARCKPFDRSELSRLFRKFQRQIRPSAMTRKQRLRELWPEALRHRILHFEEKNDRNEVLVMLRWRDMIETCEKVGKSVLHEYGEVPWALSFDKPLEAGYLRIDLADQVDLTNEDDKCSIEQLVKWNSEKLKKLAIKKEKLERSKAIESGTGSSIEEDSDTEDHI